VRSRIAFIDFETTGPNPLEDRPTEVACVITDRDWNVLAKFQSFMWEESYPELTPEIEQLTHIKQPELIRFGKHPKIKMQELWDFLNAHTVNYLVAHNSDFDRVVLESELARHGITSLAGKWICTIKDVPYDTKYRCKILSHLALDHGIDVDPSALHRAMGDVTLLISLLTNGGYSLEEILTNMSEPWVYLKAEIKPPWEDNGAGKDAARADGYSWQKDMRWGDGAPSFPKTWVKRIKRNTLDTEKLKTVPFIRRIIQEDIQ
jgi:DNA polymerase III epsilon subunit-like protein